MLHAKLPCIQFRSRPLKGTERPLPLVVIERVFFLLLRGSRNNLLARFLLAGCVIGSVPERCLFRRMILQGLTGRPSLVPHWRHQWPGSAPRPRGRCFALASVDIRFANLLYWL